MHENQKTGDCFPSYARIARMTGINRSTVIDYVKRLRARNLVDPRHRFKEDGSHTSNQYDFQTTGMAVPAQNQGTEASAPAKKSGLSTEIQSTEKSVPCGSRPERPAVVGPPDPPSRPERPEPSEANKKKERTIAEGELMPTERQKTCLHPTTEIMLLSDNVIICHHCYGLLDENLKLVEETLLPAEAVAA
jgi:DNA-binding transcriptional MocR family regulator